MAPEEFLWETAQFPGQYRLENQLYVIYIVDYCKFQFVAIFASAPETPGNAVNVLPHQALQSHNKYRALHHSPPLNWSEGLAAEAQALAQNLATQSSLAGRKDSAMDLGQNLAKLAGI